MASVLKQTYSNIEYIVIDGGSNDGSKAYIENHKDSLAYWVSKPDQGIYHAMNKGIDRATGDYLLFLNSGDWLMDRSVIEKVVEAKPIRDIVYGYLEILEVEEGMSRLKKYPENLTFSYFFKDSLPHSGGTFIKRNCFKNDLKYYDEDLKIVSDWKWFLIGLFKKNYSYQLIDKVIGVFEYGTGISSLQENRKLLLDEKQQVLDSEFKNLYPEIKALSSFKKVQTKFMRTKYYKIAYALKKRIDKFVK
jgi:glycosyltransferase involved in cell wall biosynthesis